MANDNKDSGTIKTSVSLSLTLWNKIQRYTGPDEMTFSRWVQKSSRLLLKTLEKHEVNDFLDSLNDEEFKTLNIEIKKRSR